MLRLACSSLVVLTLACGALPADPPDAGQPRVDAGRPDAGIGQDAGLTPDAGELEDAGVVSDAGQTEDAGFTEDAGDEDGDYDGGDDQSYDAGTDAPEEDAGIVVPDAGVAPPEVTVVEANLRVLHWNIAGGKENDCRADLITRAVRRYVVNHDIDFVGLNELCPSQYESIRESLRDVWSLGPNATFSAYQGDGTGRIVGNGIYAKRGLSSVTKLQLGVDQYGSRNLVCGRVAGEPHLRFCSAHLSVSDTTASSQMRTVLSRLEDWWSTNGDTVFFSGDLNLAANHAGLDPIYSSNVDTPNNRNNTGRYRELDDADTANCLGFGERSTPGTSGGPCGTGGKIDFIFARQNRIVAGDYELDSLDIPADCTGPCSDHRALVGRARVRIRRD